MVRWEIAALDFALNKQVGPSELANKPISILALMIACRPSHRLQPKFHNISKCIRNKNWFQIIYRMVYPNTTTTSYNGIVLNRKYKNTNISSLFVFYNEWYGLRLHWKWWFVSGLVSWAEARVLLWKWKNRFDYKLFEIRLQIEQ